MTQEQLDRNLIGALRELAKGQDSEGHDILAAFLRKAAGRLEALTPKPTPEGAIPVRIAAQQRQEIETIATMDLMTVLTSNDNVLNSRNEAFDIANQVIQAIARGDIRGIGIKEQE